MRFPTCMYIIQRLCTRPYMTIQCNIKVPKRNYSNIRGSLHSGMPTVQLSRMVLRYSRCLILCVCVWNQSAYILTESAMFRLINKLPPQVWCASRLLQRYADGLRLTHSDFSLIFEVSGPHSWCLSCQDCLIACRYGPTHPWVSCPWVKSQQRQSYDW